MARREPKSRSRKREPTLPGHSFGRDPSQSWFGRDSCLVRRGVRLDLVVRGALVATWNEGETAIRNAMLVQLAKEPNLLLEDIAKAFRLTSEALRLIRRKAEKEGVLAVMLPANYGRRPVAAELRRQMEGLFAQGRSAEDVFRRMGGRVGRSTVSKYYRLWLIHAKEVPAPAPAQQCLPMSEAVLQNRPADEGAAADDAQAAPVAPSSETVAADEGAAADDAQAAPVAPSSETVAADEGVAADDVQVAPVAPSSETVAATEMPPIHAPRARQKSEYRVQLLASQDPARADDEERGRVRKIRPSLPRSRDSVQHLGVWMLTAMVASRGLYEKAERVLASGAPRPSLRVALDAVIAALGIGQGCVEGVRRLSTGAGAALLLSSSVPSATWVRRALGQVAMRSSEFQDQLAAERIREIQAGCGERPAVFYVDNHTRDYTGKHKLTWHWKMQDDRAVPGVTDYWIHDGHGRPISPLTAFQQGSMVEYLPRCAQMIRNALGEQAPVLVVFDRGGAFPTAMVDLQELPEGGVDFLTYERAPYQRYGREYFEKHGQAIWRRDADDKRERLILLDRGAYLGQGRGRVRRLSLLMPDDEQINLLTSSDEDARWLVEVLFARWVQENSFKYGADRWGLDQLDSRQVEHYEPGTLIPNPYHRSLEQSRDRTIEREGRLRCKLARLGADAPDREALEAKLAETVDLLALAKDALKRTKRHIAIEETHLASRLVHHKKEYKLLVDALRIACMNAEDEIADALGPYLPREAEAKRVLQNVFSAPGSLRVGAKTISVVLDPSANRREAQAIDVLLADVTRWRLTHPGDPFRRPLRFAQKRAASPQGA
jgi:hypothetical protein